MEENHRAGKYAHCTPEGEGRGPVPTGPMFKVLGYGHSKKFCGEPTDTCIHCGGMHHKAKCADWTAAVPPAGAVSKARLCTTQFLRQ
ncbi:unnamed protein product [Euphydryas editha]|uniref:Gag protein n=1 Tax=Euphydryas editha TaxID=104508 RepID=A0AAU9UG27_EUPED|nr:unnamed protein product [Euphydryas editha]